MTDADFLRNGFASLELNGEFSEAVLMFSDGSSLCFRHTVGERTAKSRGIGETTLAARLLTRISMFRLNPKHLDIQFEDGSRWESLFARGRA
jgi:hypothetical protein